MPRIIGRRFGVALFVVFLVFMASSPAMTADAWDVRNDLNTGPYVEKVVFKEIPDRHQRILALLRGDIDFQDKFLTPNEVQSVVGDPDINITMSLRNGYGLIDINCGKYPFNISGFRQAFAFAFDKARVRAEIFQGLAQEHDSVVPYVMDWCIEDQLLFHYYLAQPEVGNQILDDLKFDVDSVSGFRNAPDGSPFKVIIEYGSQSEEVGGSTARAGVDALLSLHINAEARYINFIELLWKKYNHEDFDMLFYGKNWYSKDVDWLAYDFWSENKDVPFFNPCNFENDTFDSWVNQLLYSIEKADVYEAAAEMQRILHKNVPRLVVYQNIIAQAYRNDVFTGHVQELGGYISGPWTLRKIHRIDDTPGGIVNIGYEGVNTFNIFSTPSTSSLNRIITPNIWPSLYVSDPNLESWPYLADSLLMETHTDNPAVQMGHTRFTVDIIQNATWSDGTPLTASDIAFTYTYLYESGILGNPSSVRLRDLVAAYAPTTYRAVIEFNTESYWHFSNFAYSPIIPKHIFNDVDGIGYDNWNTWDPMFYPSHPFVTSGPFNITDFEYGEFCELSANSDFCYYPTRNTTTTTDPTTGPTTDLAFADNLTIIAGAIGAAAVILIGGYSLLRPDES